MAMQSIDTHELITPSPAMFSGLDSFAVRYGDVAALVGRLALGWIFFKFGYDKLQNVAGFAGYLTSLGVPAPGFFAWVATLTEVVMGLALIFGIATRYAAIGSFIYLILTILIAHRFWELTGPARVAQYNNFHKNLAMLCGSLLLFVTGPGRFSVDGWLRKQGR